MRTMFDAAEPQSASRIASFDVAAGYIGYPAATPHVWSKEDWDSQPCRYRLPIFVPSFFAGLGWDSVRDPQSAASSLAVIGCPQGSYIGLDMETQVQPSYVQLFIQEMNHRGFGVLVYGSKNYVLQNLIPVGSAANFWVADWTGTPHLYGGSGATQYGSVQGAGFDYDLNLIADNIPLWDTQTGVATMSLELNTPVPASPAMVSKYPDITGLGFNTGDQPQFGTLIGWVGARVAHIANKIDTGVPVIGAAPTGVSLSDADVQRIAQAVAREISKGLSNG